MRIVVENNGEIILDLTEDNALAPMGQSERAIVFHALTKGLALISGITPLWSSHATEAGMDAHFQTIDQCHEGRKSGIVIPLRGQRDTLVDGSRS